MLVIPFSTDAGSYKLFVILEDDNIERCKRLDPAQIQVPMPGFERHRLSRIFIGYASPEQKAQILAMVAQGNVGEALKQLSRGFEFRPDLGDYDGPPLSLKPEKGRTQQ